MDEVDTKRRQALVISCIAILIALVYLAMLYYFFESSKIDYKVWDVDTVTASDFTVESIITEQTWTNFLASPQAKQASNKMAAFSSLYMEEIIKVTQIEEGVLSSENVEIKVSNITYAFDNVQLLKLLTTRGNAMTNA